mgnify:CR=1 FL=1
MGKRIVFTGGSGKAGRIVVPWLRDKGHDPEALRASAALLPPEEQAA